MTTTELGGTTGSTLDRRPPADDPVSRLRASARRMRALGVAELRLLWRNKTALAYAALMPPAAFLWVGQTDAFGDSAGAALVASIAVLAFGMSAYYNLATAYTARREEYVLKRLRTGELADGEILAGTALPSVAIAWIQVVAAIVIGFALGELDTPTNALLIVLAMLIGTAVFPLIAAATSALTRTAEMAQITTTPILIIPLILSGLFFPIPEMSDGFRQIAQVMPLTPIVDLMRLGLLGLDQNGEQLGTAATFTAALPSLAVGLAWVVLGTYATRRWFRWEPRR